MVLGPNGSGKSTLINLIASVLTGETAGVIDSIEADKVQILNTEIPHPRVGWVRQEPEDNFVSRCSGDEIILPFLHQSLGQEEIVERISELLIAADVPNGNILQQPLNTLSAGETQRLAACVALGPAPDLLLCDEGFSRVDCSGRDRVASLMRAALPETAMLFATHQPDLIVDLFNGFTQSYISVSKTSDDDGVDRIRVTQQPLEANCPITNGFPIATLDLAKQSGLSKFVNLHTVAQLDLINNGVTRHHPVVASGAGELLWRIPNLEIRSGEKALCRIVGWSICAGINVILGGNGSGKTTFGHWAAGLIPLNPLLRRQKARLAFGQLETRTVLGGRPKPLRQSGLSVFLPAEPDKWLCESSVQDEIALYHWGVVTAEQSSVLNEFQIPLTKRVDQLSYGQRKALSIVSLPETLTLVFIDEPFVDLSYASAQSISRFIKMRVARQQWRCVVLSTASAKHFFSSII